MPLFSVASEVDIAIIPPLIMEEDPGAIVVLVSSGIGYSIWSTGLEKEILSTWCAWLYLASKTFKLKLNIFNLGPFGGAHGVSCRLLIRRIILYRVL